MSLFCKRSIMFANQINSHFSQCQQRLNLFTDSSCLENKQINESCLKSPCIDVINFFILEVEGIKAMYDQTKSLWIWIFLGSFSGYLWTLYYSQTYLNLNNSMQKADMWTGLYCFFN